jgi:hypothetical protein
VDEVNERTIMCLATQGHGHLDEQRIMALLAPLSPELYPFQRAHKLRSGLGLFRAARAARPQLIVMEGTGIAGGIALIAIRALLGIPYVISSGDAVAPYLSLRSRAAGLLGAIYERALCRRCAGFIGWTPYLVGRALTFGAPRAMTAPGWGRGAAAAGARERIRAQLQIPGTALVAGLVGSLTRNARLDYTYGAELIRAIKRVQREDVVICVVGDGSGLAALQELAGEDLGRRVLLPGHVAAEEVADHLAAFDVASLPQSVDGVGSFRYTTKLSEYLAAGLPVLTSQIPAAYDLDEGGIWRLPGAAPWSETYVQALAELLEGLSGEEIARRRELIAGGRSQELFSLAAQRTRVCAFVEELLSER